MTDQHDNYSKAAKAYDNFISTDIKAEREAAKDRWIEYRAIEIYHEILDVPEMMAEALTEIQYDAEYQAFATALGDAIRNEIPQWDVQYLAKIRDTGGEILMGYADMLATAQWENMQ